MKRLLLGLLTVGAFSLFGGHGTANAVVNHCQPLYVDSYDYTNNGANNYGWGNTLDCRNFTPYQMTILVSLQEYNWSTNAWQDVGGVIGGGTGYNITYLHVNGQLYVTPYFGLHCVRTRAFNQVTSYQYPPQDVNTFYLFSNGECY